MKDPESRIEVTRIIHHFHPECQVESCTIIETGHINRTYKVVVNSVDSKEKNHKTYLLQNLNTDVFTRPLAVMHNISRSAQFLKNLKPDYPFEVLNPIPLKDSEEYIFSEGKNTWRLFDFIENTKSLDRVTTAEEAFEIGNAFGVFLASINQDDPDQYEITIPDFHNFTKRYTLFTQYLKSQKVPQSEKEVHFLIDQIHHSAGTYIDLEKLEFPTRIIHHDTKANNVLLDSKTGRTRCIIDMDTLMPGLIFSDFGDLMRTVFNPYEEDKFPKNGKLVANNIISSLLSGFLSPLNEMLTNSEKEYLIAGGKKIIFLQILRFLEDHLKGDVYYQIKYPGHNLDRAYSQMRLYTALDQSKIALPV